MSRHANELSIPEVATQLEVHPNTVRNWAQASVSGEPSKLREVRRDITGHYWISKTAVQSLQKETADAMSYPLWRAKTLQR